MNPFSFGNPVTNEYYLPRPELNGLVRNYLENRIHVVLKGPRRFGKTSFVQNLLTDMEDTHICLFADVFNITSHRDFLQQILRALRAQSRWGRRFKEWAETIPRLRPRLGWEISEHGQYSFSLSADISDDRDVKETIQDVLSGIASLGERVVFVIDEFQQVAELEDDGWLEATLRTQMQQLRNTAFLFTGSRQSLLNDMLNDQTRPFYRSCQQIDFPVFGEEFIVWVAERFASVHIGCDREAIRHLRDEVQNTPNYMQMACFHLVAKGVRHVGVEDVRNVLNTIVGQNSYAYQTLLGTLSLMQQRILRLAAIEKEQIFLKDNLEKYEISSGAALSSAIKALKKKHILDEGSARGRVLFDDPLFAIWLRKEFSIR